MSDEETKTTTEEKKFRLHTILTDQDMITLRKESLPVAFVLGDNSGRGHLDKTTKELIEALKDYIVEHDGLGMAAIQLGVAKRVFVMRKPFNSENLITVINPKLIRGSGQSIKAEGCFSVPDVPDNTKGARIKRWSHIFVNYRDEEDVLHQEQMFVGMDARIWLHEFDHLNGEIILDDQTLTGKFMGWERLFN